MSSSRCPPYESDAASARSTPASPVQRSSSAVSALISRNRVRVAERVEPRGCRACTARRMFSSTGNPPNRLVIWKDRPTPASVTACGSSPAMDVPSR